MSLKKAFNKQDAELAEVELLQTVSLKKIKAKVEALLANPNPATLHDATELMGMVRVYRGRVNKRIGIAHRFDHMGC